MSYNLTIDNIINSKGPVRNSYSTKDTEYNSSEKEIIDLINNSNNVIFIRNGSFKENKDLFYFAKNIKLLTKPTILVTSDGDRPMPFSYPAIVSIVILKNKFIKYWYTQNYDKSIKHKKLRYLPIGFNFHTSSWLINNNKKKKLKYMIETRKNKDNNKIKYRILSDTHHIITHIEREYLHLKLKKNKLITFTAKMLSFKDIFKLYNDYTFVLSPRGNGMDCHRTWELLLAGCIIITRTSPLDEMYIKNNLPVVILKSWTELNKNLLEKLKKWYNQHIHKTSIENIFPKLTYDYWIKL